MTEAKIEFAKSYFNLAEIFIILAGFSFALAGIFYNGSIETLNTGIQVINQIGQNPQFPISVYTNMSKTFQDKSDSQKALYQFCLYFGILLILFSFISWFKGRKKIKKLMT